MHSLLHLLPHAAVELPALLQQSGILLPACLGFHLRQQPCKAAETRFCLIFSPLCSADVQGGSLAALLAAPAGLQGSRSNTIWNSAVQRQARRMYARKRSRLPSAAEQPCQHSTILVTYLLADHSA